MFPISVAGTVRLKMGVPVTDAMVRAACDRIADMLDEAMAGSSAADNVRIEGNTVHFYAAWFALRWNWNFLAPFDKGQIIVELHRNAIAIRYTLSTVNMLLLITSVLAAIGAFVVWGKPDILKEVRTIAPYLGLGWLWLFGMNYLIGMIRAPLWLRRGLRKDPELRKR